MTDWPLDEQAYRDDDLYYASTATGSDVPAEDKQRTERETAYRFDDQRTHALFRGIDSPLTLCGKRPLETPGRGEIDCPDCLEALADAARAQREADQAIEQCGHCGHYRVNGSISHADWCRNR